MSHLETFLLSKWLSGASSDPKRSVIGDAFGMTKMKHPGPNGPNGPNSPNGPDVPKKKNEKRTGPCPPTSPPLLHLPRPIDRKSVV